jgi:hypothetical protein
MEPERLSKNPSPRGRGVLGQSLSISYSETAFNPAPAHQQNPLQREELDRGIRECAP